MVGTGQRVEDKGCRTEGTGCRVKIREVVGTGQRVEDREAMGKSEILT